MRDIEKTNGVQQPPVCVCVDGVYYSLDGSRRTKVCELLGYPLTIEATDDYVSDEDCELYIKSTDVNTNQSIFEKAMVAFNEYMDVKSSRERVSAEKFKDASYAEETGMAVSHLTRIKKVCTTYNYRFFENGDTNKFGFRELISMSQMVLKQRVNKGEKFDDLVDIVFSRCVDEFGSEWDEIGRAHV